MAVDLMKFILKIQFYFFSKKLIQNQMLFEGCINSTHPRGTKGWPQICFYFLVFDFPAFIEKKEWFSIPHYTHYGIKILPSQWQNIEK